MIDINRIRENPEGVKEALKDPKCKEEMYIIECAN